MLTKYEANRYNRLCLFGVISMMLSRKELAAKGHPVALSGTFDMSDLLKERKDVVSFGKVKAELEAHSDNGVAVIEGTLWFPVELVCSRCLGPVKETLEIPFREVFTDRPEIIPKEELEDVHVVADDRIELAPYVEEAVWLELPFAPVCDEDCKGLCPVCGRNRNLEPCGCSTDRVDPRLAGLADFFKQE